MDYLAPRERRGLLESMVAVLGTGWLSTLFSTLSSSVIFTFFSHICTLLYILSLVIVLFPYCYTPLSKIITLLFAYFLHPCLFIFFSLKIEYWQCAGKHYHNPLRWDTSLTSTSHCAETLVLLLSSPSLRISLKGSRVRCSFSLPTFCCYAQLLKTRTCFKPRFMPWSSVALLCSVLGTAWYTLTPVCLT